MASRAGLAIYFLREDHGLIIFRVAQSLADLGLPVNGADGIFLPMNGPSGWAGDFAPMPEAW
jgi:hypothetical protein